MYLSHTMLERIQQYRQYYSSWNQTVIPKDVYEVKDEHFWGCLLLAVSNFMLEKISARDMQFLSANTNRFDLKKIYRECDSLSFFITLCSILYYSKNELPIFPFGIVHPLYFLLVNIGDMHLQWPDYAVLHRIPYFPCNFLPYVERWFFLTLLEVYGTMYFSKYPNRKSEQKIELSRVEDYRAVYYDFYSPSLIEEIRKINVPIEERKIKYSIKE